jgi:gluconolactonase
MAHDALDPAFRRLIDEHAPVRQVGSGFTFTEGPIWHPGDQYLLFSDMPADVRRRLDRSGVRESVRPSNKANGLTCDAELNDRLRNATSSVAASGRTALRGLASHFEGANSIVQRSVHPFERCDLLLRSWFGGCLFMGSSGRATSAGRAFRLAPGSREPKLLVDRYMFSQPNGLCFCPVNLSSVKRHRTGQHSRFDVAPMALECTFSRAASAT